MPKQQLEGKPESLVKFWAEFNEAVRVVLVGPKTFPDKVNHALNAIDNALTIFVFLLLKTVFLIPASIVRGIKMLLVEWFGKDNWS